MKVEKTTGGGSAIPEAFLGEVEQLLRGELSDPFHLLGPHWIERNGKSFLSIRAFRAGATAATILWQGGQKVIPAAKLHPDGFFEAILPGEAVPGNSQGTIKPNSYRIRWDFANGSQLTLLDPYAFPLVLTDRS